MSNGLGCVDGDDVGVTQALAQFAQLEGGATTAGLRTSGGVCEAPFQGCEEGLLSVRTAAAVLF